LCLEGLEEEFLPPAPRLDNCPNHLDAFPSLLSPDINKVCKTPCFRLRRRRSSAFFSSPSACSIAAPSSSFSISIFSSYSSLSYSNVLAGRRACAAIRSCRCLLPPMIALPYSRNLFHVFISSAFRLAQKVERVRSLIECLFEAEINFSFQPRRPSLFPGCLARPEGVPDSLPWAGSNPRGQTGGQASLLGVNWKLWTRRPRSFGGSCQWTALSGLPPDSNSWPCASSSSARVVSFLW